MQISAVKTEDGKVSCETAEGTVVHININQHSAFDCLLDALHFLRNMKKSEPKAAPSRTTGSAGHLGFGGAYVSLGLVSVTLAIVIVAVQPHLGIFYSGVHFWVGFPFLVSGILNLVAYRFPNACWMGLAFISLLVNFDVSIAGMFITADDIQYLRWSIPSEAICSDLLQDRNYDRATRFPSYDNGREYDLQRCITDRYCKDMRLLFVGFAGTLKCGLLIISLLMIWGLCLAILNVGLRVKSFCCVCKGGGVQVAGPSAENYTPLMPNVTEGDLSIWLSSSIPYRSDDHTATPFTWGIQIVPFPVISHVSSILWRTEEKDDPLLKSSSSDDEMA